MLCKVNILYWSENDHFGDISDVTRLDNGNIVNIASDVTGRKNGTVGIHL
jgi:hypothetical protein